MAQGFHRSNRHPTRSDRRGTPRSPDGRRDRRHRGSPNARRAQDDRCEVEDRRAALRREVERRADRRSAGVANEDGCDRQRRSTRAVRRAQAGRAARKVSGGVDLQVGGRRSVRRAFRASIYNLPIEDGHLDAHRGKVGGGRLEDVVRQDNDVGEHARGDGAFALLVE